MPRPVIPHRVAAFAAVLTVLTAMLIGASASSADLTTRQHELQQGIKADNGAISTLAQRLSDLRGRLDAVAATLKVQQDALAQINDQLSTATEQMTQLRSALGRDQKLLAAQMVAQYESPTPNLIGVIMNANGFPALLNQVSRMRTLAQHNGEVVQATARQKAAVTIQAAELKQAHTRQLRVMAAALSERDQIASLQLTILKQEHVAEAGRAQHQRELDQVTHKLKVLQARAAAAQRASFAAADPTSATYGSGGNAVDSGDYGFFPAAGTNYSVGEEPELASRLGALGRALHLHLIGISGYRSPEHSLEVGGFADDPHTRGEASDTPGVEGVPEATLEQFGLTRPFPGPAEADHIQLS
jgi:peptidoglycan hydrolase CwlO-like protein